MIENPLQHSLGAVNVGSSVLAVRYKDGVMIAADTAISYGGMRKEKDARRIKKLNDECIYASSGEMADFQNLIKMLEKKQQEDAIEQDGATFLKPRDYFNWVARNNYQRRLKMDPLWCMTIIAGLDKSTGEFFLGQVDLYGTRIEHKYLHTGIAAHYCQVLMENGQRNDMTEEEARKLMTDCARILFYRDKKAYDKL